MLRPTQVFGLYWATLVVATFVFYPDSYLSVRNAALIGIGVTAFTLGVWVATASPRGRRGHAHPTTVRTALHTKTIKLLVVLGVISNLVAVVLTTRAHGVGLGALFSLEGLLSTGHTASVARYAGEQSSPLVVLLLTMGYAAAIAAPFLRAYGVGWVVILAPLGSSVIYSAVTTARLGMLLTAAFTVAGIISASVLERGDVPRLSLRLVASVTAGALALGMVFTAVAFIRVGRIDGSIAAVVIEKQRTYALGALPAFSEWLDEYRAPDSDRAVVGLGTASLAGVELLTGQSREDSRAYDEFEIIDPDSHSTNVYTVFRGLVLDFGLAGSLLVLALSGFAFGRLFRQVRHNASAPAAGLLACGYALVLLSNTMAITSFTSVVLAMALAVIALRRAERLGIPHALDRSMVEPASRAARHSKVQDAAQPLR